MKKLTHVILLTFISLLFYNCNNNNGNSISFILAKNYFVKNTFDSCGVYKIYNQDNFNRIFGMATVMGENGKPTPINFNNEGIIAIISNATDTLKTISVNSDNKSINYNIINGEKLSYTIKPFQIIIVKKDILKDIQVLEK